MQDSGNPELTLPIPGIDAMLAFSQLDFYAYLATNYQYAHYFLSGKMGEESLCMPGPSSAGMSRHPGGTHQHMNGGYTLLLREELLTLQ